MPSWLDHSTKPSFQRSNLLQRSSTSDSTIPKQLQAAIPDCARPCVSNWITTQYPQTCRDSSCLCDSYSDDSYALGEIALICVMSEDCAGATDDETAGSAYAVCSSEPDAVPRTHTALTTTVNGPAPQSTSSKASQTTSPTSQTAVTTLTGSHATSSTVPTATSTPTLGATPTSAADTASGAATSKPTLTSGQAVGVSIGAIAGVVIIVCIVYLLACLRRRKAKREQANQQSYDFVDEGSTKYSFASEPPHGPRHSDHVQPKMGSELPIQKHNTIWPTQHYQPQHFVASVEDKRVRQLSEVRSNASMRTVSQLLPERPGSKPPPPPSKMATSPQPIQTPATIFEEEHVSMLPRVLMPGLPAHPAVLKTRQPRSHGPPHPTLTLDIPGQPTTTTTSSHDMRDWPLRPPQALTNSQDRLSGRSGAFSSKTSLLDYYASADSGTSPYSVPDSATPIEEAIQVRRPAPAAIVVGQPSYFPKAVRDSVASDTSRRTSFESNMPDELTPPEEDERRLSPVAESPISNVRYPRVPRSSNQAIPRSPVYSGYSPSPNIRLVSPEYEKSRGHSPSLSGSTLAAKRRGDSAAQMLEQGLHIDNSAHHAHSRKNSEHERHDPPTQHEIYGQSKIRNKSSNPAPNYPLTIQLKSPADSLRSPLWNGKFTPTRRGDDLYLSVEKAPRESRYYEVYD